MIEEDEQTLGKEKTNIMKMMGNKLEWSVVSCTSFNRKKTKQKYKIHEFMKMVETTGISLKWIMCFSATKRY